ncbi:hypothetical protein ACWF2L_38455 [Streptomyces anulatus]
MPITSDKTRTSYARDWELWAEFHRWLAGQTGHVLPLTAVTKGTLVAFVVWLDEMKKAAPSTIDRRITGVTVTARRHGTEVPKQATKAAREALKPMKLDPARTVRGRGKAIAATPMHLKAMNTATAARPQPAVGVVPRSCPNWPGCGTGRWRRWRSASPGAPRRSPRSTPRRQPGCRRAGGARPLGQGPPAPRRRGRLRREPRYLPGPLLAGLEGSRRPHRGSGLPARRPEGPPRHPMAAVSSSPGPPSAPAWT